MEVNLLEVREDGYHAYCVIFNQSEIVELEELRHGDSIEDMIKWVIEVGMGE